MPRTSLKGDPELEAIRANARASQTAQGLMGDIEALKNSAMEELHHGKPYDVMDFYYTEGIVQKIARSGPFTNVTLAVISINAVWMGYDTDKNDSDTLAGAEIQFQIGEHFFAVFFSIELLIRFLAFQKKRNCLKDGWFKFDSVLCTLMVLETWILPLAAGDGGGLPIDTSMLRLLRLLRLSRMMRLLRKVPELITLLKGIVAATRSVFSTLVLLIIFMYVFAIILRQQAAGNDELAELFGSMGLCFWTLLLHGTILDDITDPLTAIKDDSPGLAVVFLSFVLIGNFTILNMLIGVICEVVSAVSEMEGEKSVVQFAKDSFLAKLKEMDADGSATISHDEWEEFITEPSLAPAFKELDVDIDGLMALTEVIFEDDVQVDESTLDVTEDTTTGGSQFFQARALEFGEVIEQILMLRNSNAAVVKDMVDMRKYFKGQSKKTHVCMVQIAKLQMQFLDFLKAGKGPVMPASPSNPPPKAAMDPAISIPAAPPSLSWAPPSISQSAQVNNIRWQPGPVPQAPSAQPSAQDKGILDFLLACKDVAADHSSSLQITPIGPSGPADEKTQHDIDELRNRISALGTKVSHIHSLVAGNGSEAIVEKPVSGKPA